MFSQKTGVEYFPVWDIMPKNEKGYIVMSLDTEKMTSFSGCMGESFVDFKIFFFT